MEVILMACAFAIGIMIGILVGLYNGYNEGYKNREYLDNVPKKPIRGEHQYYCPSCNYCLDDYRADKYCYHCGTAIDWSEDDNKHD